MMPTHRFPPSAVSARQSPLGAGGTGKVWAAAALLLLLVGCSSQRVAPPAPVEDRGAARTQAVVPGGATALPPVEAGTPPLPGAENAGKPGYYTVRPGDTLIRIALEAGQNWKDIARWNQIENPNKIEKGQVLRVIPPTAASLAAARPAPTSLLLLLLLQPLPPPGCPRLLFPGLVRWWLNPCLQPLPCPHPLPARHLLPPLPKVTAKTWPSSGPQQAT
jgi:lipoprotein NlpD